MNYLFSVKTHWEKTDRRKAMYIANFFIGKRIIYLMTISFAVGILLSYMIHNKFQFFAKYWAGTLVLSFIKNILELEYRLYKVIKIDSTWNATHQYDFYEDHLIVFNSSIEGEVKLKYEQYLNIIESKDYFFLFHSIGSTSMIRKKDMNKEVSNKLRKLFKEKLGTKYMGIGF